MTTTPRYNTKHGRNLGFWEAVSATNPTDFTTNGAVRGTSHPYESGNLTDTHRSAFKADAPTFAVYSYSTPIAWRKADGTWVMPDARYSVSTSVHQGRTRLMLSNVTVQSI